MKRGVVWGLGRLKSKKGDTFALPFLVILLISLGVAFFATKTGPGFSTITGFASASSTSCGDLVSDVTLIQNVIKNGTCFNVLVSNVLLDCAGFSVVNNDSSIVGYGVYVNSFQNVTVRNCNFFNYTNGAGIRIENTDGQVVVNSTNIYNSSYGLYARDSKNLLIQGVNATNSTTNGIYFLRINHSVINRANAILTGADAGIKLESSTNNTIANANSSINPSGLILTASNYIFAENSVFTSNSAFGLDLQTTSTNNSFRNILSNRNSIAGARFQSAATNNSVLNGSFDLNLIGVSFFGNENVLISSRITDTTLDYVRMDANDINITFINTIYDKNKVNFTAPFLLRNKLNVTWFTDVVVTNGTNPVSGATVNISNSSGLTLFYGTTNSTGHIPTQTLVEKLQTSSANQSFNPYTFTANKSGVFGGSASSTQSIISGPTTVTLNFAANNCGNVNNNTLLQGNLVASVESCINITGSNMVFDCNGYSITGPGSSVGGAIGIFAVNVTNITVKRCVIQEFIVGIMYKNASLSSIVNNTFINNGNYGVALGDLGINSSSNLILNNTFLASGLLIGSGSERNLLDRNTLNSTFSILSGHNNIISNSSIANVATAIVADSTSLNNSFINVVLENTTSDLSALASSNTTFINTTFNPGKVSFGSTALLNVFWFVDTQVTDGTNPVSGAEVNITDNRSTLLFSGSTNAAGNTQRTTIFQTIVNATGNSSFTPHNFTVSKSGSTFVRSEHINSSRLVNITFTPCGFVNGNYALASNISISGQTCLTVNASNIVISCSGFAVSSDNTASTYGVYVSGFNNVTIRDCTISNFHRGIFATGSGNVSMINNTIHSNNDGNIFVLSSSNTRAISNNLTNASQQAISTALTLSSSHSSLVENNSISINRNGIAVSGSLNVNVTGNTIYNNTYFGISLSAGSNNASLSRNVISEQRQTATSAGVQISQSENITLAGDRLISNLFGVRVITGSPGVIGSRNNQFRSMHLENNSNAFSFESNENQTVFGTTLHNNTVAVLVTTTSNSSIINSTITPNNFGTHFLLQVNGTNITSLNTAFNRSRVQVFDSSYLNVKWFLNVFAQEQNGIPIGGATVNATDFKGIQSRSSTASNGFIAQRTVTEAIINSTTYDPFTPHDIFGNHSSYGFDNSSQNITSSRQINLTLIFPPSITGTSATSPVYQGANVTINATVFGGSTIIDKVFVVVYNGATAVATFFLNLVNAIFGTYSGTIQTNGSFGADSNYTVYANESQFGRISQLGGSFVVINPCGNLINTSITLVNNISGNSCMVINSNNIVIDCMGYSIIGNGTGTGINITGFSNVTLRNCTITNFSVGVLKQNSQNGNFVSPMNVFGNSINFFIQNDPLVVNGNLTFAPGNSVVQNTVIHLVEGNLSNQGNLSWLNTTLVMNHTGISKIENFGTWAIDSRSNFTTNGSLVYFFHVREGNFTMYNSKVSFANFTVRANNTRIENVTITDAAIGVNYTDSYNNVLKNATIINTIAQALSLFRSDNNSITDSLLTNGSNIISLSSVNGSRFINNTLENATGAFGIGIGISGGKNNIFSDNRFRTSIPISVSMTSGNNNILTGNDFRSSGTGLSITSSSNNTIRNSTFFGQTSAGMSIDSFSNNNSIIDSVFNRSSGTTISVGQITNLVIENSTIMNLTAGTDLSLTGGSNITLINTTFNRSSVAVTGTSSLNVTWFVRVNVTDTATGLPLSGINVSVNNTKGKFQNFTTDSTGFTPFMIVLDTNFTASVNDSYNNNTFNATYVGITDTRSVNITSSRTINLNLTGAPVVGALSGCGVINSSTTLGANITTSTSGSCFLINASGITFNCNNFNITGGGSGVGINISHQTSVTLQNCNINNFSIGLYKFNNSAVQLTNNNIFNNTQNIVSINDPTYIAGITFTGSNSIQNSVFVTTGNVDNTGNLTWTNSTLIFNASSIAFNNTGSALITDSSSFTGEVVGWTFFARPGSNLTMQHSFVSRSGTLTINANRTVLTNNSFENIGGTLTFTSAQNSIVQGNTFTNFSSNIVLLTLSANYNLFENNVLNRSGSVSGSGFSVVSSSSNNTFRNNNVSNSGTGVGEGAVVFNSATNNTYIGGLVNNSNIAIAFASSASNNYILNVTINNASTAVSGASNSIGIILENSSIHNSSTDFSLSTANVTALNTQFNRTKVTLSNIFANLNVSWFMDVQVNSGGSGVSGATVSFTDNSSNSITASTDSSGRTMRILTEIIRNLGGNTNFNNYTISASASGYTTSSESSSYQNITSSRLVILNLTAVAAPGGGGGGGGGGGTSSGGGAGTFVAPCRSNWTCADWGPCQENGKRARTCTDKRNCTRSTNKPATVEDCVFTVAPAQNITPVPPAPRPVIEKPVIPEKTLLQRLLELLKTPTIIGSFIGLLVLMLIGGYAVYRLTRHPPLPPTKKEEKDLSVYEAKLDEVTNYIEDALKAGMSKPETKSSLVGAGWPEEIVERAFEIERSRYSEKEAVVVKAFIDKGHSREEIKRFLASKGWGEEKIKKIFDHLK